ncbi:MAG: hypothetical protein WCF30_09590 [Terracidiphilus sp.]
MRLASDATSLTKNLDPALVTKRERGADSNHYQAIAALCELLL